MKQTLLWLLLLTLVAVPGAFGAQTIAANPASLTFNYQPGSTIPPAQIVTLTAPDSSAPPSFSFTWTATPNVWFDVQADASHLLVGLNANRLGLLGIGTYKGSITLKTNGGDDLVIPVTLNVGVASTTLSLSPNQINFQYQPNNIFVTQNVLVSSSTAGMPFTVTTNQSWLLTNTSSGTTNATITVTANPSGLQTGNYQGNVLFTASDNTVTSLPVTLAVGVATNSLSVNPSTLSFAGTAGGGNPAPQFITVSSGSTTASFANASSNVSWLSVSPNSNFALPNTITVQPNIAGLAASATPYTGTITITGNDFSTALVSVNLTVNGTITTGVTTTVTSLTPYAGNAGTQTFAVGFNDTQGTNNFKGYVYIGSGNPNTGLANACVVEFIPSTLQLRLLQNSGNTTDWFGPVTLGTQGAVLSNSQCTINMGSSFANFTSSNSVILNVSITFAATYTRAKNISIQAVNNSGATNAWTVWGTWYPYTPGNLVNWYRLYDPNSRSHMYTTDLNEYNFLAALGFSAEGSSGVVYNAPATRAGVQAVPYFRLVNLAGGPANHHWTTDPNEYFTLIQNKSAFIGEGIASFVFPITGTRPADTIPLYRLVFPPAGAALHHWTTDTNEYNSLIANAGWKGEGFAAFILPVGTNTLSEPVDVSSASDEAIIAVVNAATNTVGAIAPGSRIRILGRNFQPDSAVTIGGIPAKVLSAKETSIDVLVPEGIKGSSTSVHVNGAGRGRKVAVRQTSPSLFAVNLFGNGQVVANNGDGTRNSVDNPAAKGSTVILHANGVGSDPAAIKVTFDGIPGTVLGVEQAADGLAKIQVVVPTELGAHRTIPVRVHIGLETSQEGVNFSVQP